MQIARLVESSRRTVVFLTPNFIEYFQNKLNKKTVYKTTSGMQMTVNKGTKPFFSKANFQMKNENPII